MARLCPPGKFRRALDLVEGDFASGLEELEFLARAYPKDPAVRAALGMAYVDDERPFEALPHLEWAERKDPPPDLQHTLLATYLALDMPQHAMRLAARSGRLSWANGLDEDAPESPGFRGVTLPTQDRLAFERARVGLLHGEPGAATALERLLAKHPGYQPARNLLVTHEFLEGDIERYMEVAREAFALAPDDPHALLNAARAALMRGGVEAARALRPHADALEPDAGWGADRFLARAGALALMDDADATEAALGAFRQRVAASGDDRQVDVADAIEDMVERRRRDPRAPVVDLGELTFALAARWRDTGLERVQKKVVATLAGMPGLLRELPDLIGHQTPDTVRLLAASVLLPGAPPPPGGDWGTVLQRVARHGPGTREARQALLLLLAETGRNGDDDGEDGDDDEVTSLDAGRDPSYDATDEDDDAGLELPDVPDLNELAALPKREERWCIALRPAVFMIGEDPEPTLTWVGVVAADDGLVRLAQVEAEPYHADSLYAILAQACAGGMAAAEPGRPRLVSLEDVDLAADLAERLAPLGIDVLPGDVEPALVAVRGLAAALGGGVPAWLADADDDQAEDFFDATLAFYDAAPWHRFRADRFVAFRVGDGPWRYANVMGQAGEEFGVAVYAGWREANAYVEDPGEDGASAAERLASIGWLEGLSLADLATLSPLDAGRYLDAGMEPDLDGEVPAWLRFEPDGPALPEHGPGVVSVLIAVLTEEARNATRRVRRIDVTHQTPAGRMRVVYPATGEEPGADARTPSARG